MAKKYRTKSGKVEEKLPGINATVSPSEKAQIAMAGGANTLSDVQTILGQQGKRNNLKGQGAKNIVSFQWTDDDFAGFSPNAPSSYSLAEGTSNIGGLDVSGGIAEKVMSGPAGAVYGGRGDDTDDPSQHPLSKTLDANKRQAVEQKVTGPSNIYDPGLGAPGDNRGMAVYGIVNGQLTWLGTEGFGDPESLGDISQWSPSDYTRGGKPSSLAGKGKGSISAGRKAWNLKAAEQPGPLNPRDRASIQKEMRVNKPGFLDKLGALATDTFTKPWSALQTEKVLLSAAFGPLGTAFGFFQGRGINEPPETPIKQPFTYAKLSQGTVKRQTKEEPANFKETEKTFGIPDQPGPAYMPDPKGYSRFSPVNGGDDTPKKKKLFRDASNNTTLANGEANGEGPTRKQKRYRGGWRTV
jgi:hypothetical protein